MTAEAPWQIADRQHLRVTPKSRKGVVHVEKPGVWVTLLRPSAVKPTDEEDQKKDARELEARRVETCIACVKRPALPPVARTFAKILPR